MGRVVATPDGCLGKGSCVQALGSGRVAGHDRHMDTGIVAVEASLFPEVCPDRRYGATAPRSAEPRRTPPPNTITIEITYAGVLSVDEVWPDKDWPRSITAEAVEAAIERGGGPSAVVADWNLPQEDVVVTVS